MKWDKGPTLQDSPRERRIRRAEKITGMQIMPRMAKVNFWCMIISAVISVVLETVQFLRFSRDFGMGYLLRRAVSASLICWSFFALILILSCLIQLRRIRNGHVETRYIERTPGDDRDPFVPLVDPQPKYHRYMRVAVAGEAILLVLFAGSRLF